MAEVHAGRSGAVVDDRLGQSVNVHASVRAERERTVSKVPISLNTPLSPTMSVRSVRSSTTDFQ